MDETRAVPAASASEAKQPPTLPTSPAADPARWTPAAGPAHWIICRCTQRWRGTRLIYEDFAPTAGMLMTEGEARTKLDECARAFPDEEFSAHRISEHCDPEGCADHMHLHAALFGSGLPSAADLDLVAEEAALKAATKRPDDQADGFADAGVRCSACGTFRHASPRHEAHCRYAGQNCPGCASGRGETHIASCAIASQFKLPTDDCCEGVDLPSIGNVHTPTCRQARPVVRASYTLPQVGPHAPSSPLPGDGLAALLPPPSSAGEFAGPAGLFGQLLFAARDLGRSRVSDLGFAGIYSLCLECNTSDTHHPTCRTGRVLGLVDRICAVAPPFQAAAAVEDDLPPVAGAVKTEKDIFMQVDEKTGRVLGFVQRERKIGEPPPSMGLQPKGGAR